MHIEMQLRSASVLIHFSRILFGDCYPYIFKLNRKKTHLLLLLSWLSYYFSFKNNNGE